MREEQERTAETRRARRRREEGSARRQQRGWLAPGSPELARAGDLAAARATIAAHVARDEEQARARTFLLEWIDAHPDALDRSCLAGHLTASSLVLDARGEHALLTLHKKLGRWLQLGGHCDGDGNLARAALCEAQEESGIAELEIDPTPIDLDCHRIPARPGEPEHWHLDTRFLARAAPGATPRINPESKELRWISLREGQSFELDDSVLRLFRLARGRES